LLSSRRTHKRPRARIVPKSIEHTAGLSRLSTAPAGTPMPNRSGKAWRGCSTVTPSRTLRSTFCRNRRRQLAAAYGANRILRRRGSTASMNGLSALHHRRKPGRGNGSATARKFRGGPSRLIAGGGRIRIAS